MFPSTKRSIFLARMEDSYEEHKEALDAASAEARAEWDADLQEMIYVFDQIANDFPDSPLFLWTSEESDKLDEQGVPHFQFIEKDAAGSVYESNLPETPDSVWEAHPGRPASLRRILFSALGLKSVGDVARSSYPLAIRQGKNARNKSPSVSCWKRSI